MVKKWLQIILQKYYKYLRLFCLYTHEKRKSLAYVISRCKDVSISGVTLLTSVTSGEHMQLSLHTCLTSTELVSTKTIHKLVVHLYGCGKCSVPQ